MNNFKISWGETLPLTVETRQDLEALEATLIVDFPTKFTKVVPFLAGVADISLSDEETQIELGVYDYQINVRYANGTLDKFPDMSGCSECQLPTITICKSLDMPESA